MAKQEHIGVRADTELKKALKGLADENGRTLSNYILYVLAKHVEESAAPRAKRRSK